MLSDIVIPNNNETEYMELASKLGFKKINFLYEFNESNQENQKKFGHIKNKKIHIGIGFIVNSKNINQALWQSKLIVVRSSDKDRIFIEMGKIKLIYGFEEIQKKDYMHQRASGLNHTACELAKKNNVAIGFSYSTLLSKSSAPLLIGRMMQNISLCQKYKVKTIIGSFSSNPYEMRAPHDIISLFTLFGMNSKTARDSIYYDL